MDIFGVGLAEVIVILLVILIIGGPKNALKWSRDLGRMIRQLRQFWTQMMAELEKDLGEDGREIMKTTREITQTVSDIRHQANPQQAIRKAARLLEEGVNETDKSLTKTARKTQAKLKDLTAAQQDKAPQPEETPPTNGRYNDWVAPKED